jgi:DnaJ-class molecular chaperone
VNRVPNAYRVLQVDQSADFIVIQAAYRALARRYHPDGDTPDAARMADVDRAFARLLGP